MGLGHFTQVVWKATTKIGCAAVTCADGTLFTGYGEVRLLILPGQSGLISSPHSWYVNTKILETSTSVMEMPMLSSSTMSDRKSRSLNARSMDLQAGLVVLMLMIMDCKYLGYACLQQDARHYKGYHCALRDSAGGDVRRFYLFLKSEIIAPHVAICLFLSTT